VSVSFDPILHKYVADGRVVPSNTEILRAMGIYGSYQFAESHHKYRGHAVHAGAAIMDMGGIPLLGPVPAHLEQVGRDIVEGYWPAFERFKARTGWQGKIWECPIVDPVRGYGGTFDAVGEMGNDLVLLDLKSGVLPEMVAVQLALYWLLITQGKPVDEEHPGLEWLRETVKSGRAVKRMALRLTKDGKDTLFSSTSKGDDYSAPKWLAVANSVLNVYNIRAQHGLFDKGERSDKS
jgi:hypothetical protein